MADNDRTLVKGVSAEVLTHYDEFQRALDKMDKYHNISNDFQVMAFSKVSKEALDNIVEMFEDPEAKKVIRAQINMLKSQARGGEASVFRGSSHPESNMFYKYMFIAKVNDDDTVDFNLCSLEKKGNLAVMKGLLESISEAGDSLTDFLTDVVTGAVVVEIVKEVAIAWGGALGFPIGRAVKELTNAEFITEFDMTKRLIDGNYCELDKNTHKLYLKQ